MSSSIKTNTKAKPTKLASKFKVRVLRRHILKGVPGDCEKCAVSLALKEKVGMGWVSVDTERATFAKTRTSQKRYEYEHDGEEFINVFDDVKCRKDRNPKAKPCVLTFTAIEEEKDGWDW